MGVRGLQTFMEKYCKSACYYVNIAELCKKYKNETGKDVVIVMDAEACFFLWGRKFDDGIGFIDEFFHRVQTFVESFKKIGVKIVFFLDGVTVEKKRETWLRRRMDDLKQTQVMFEFFEKGLPRSDALNDMCMLSPSMTFHTLMILKHVLNCEVYVTIEECDVEIVEYVNKNECLAIFAQDTDFIVSNVKCKVLSSEKFDESSMTTLLYDREILAKILNIRNDQLPLLGVLAGNDFLKSELLRDFHRSICGIPVSKYVSYDVLFPAIGQYINKLPDRSINEVLELISVRVFGSRSSLDLVTCSYNGYIFQETPKIADPPTKWSEILQVARVRHRNAIVPSFIWGVLKDQVFELDVPYEDLRKTSNNRLPANSFIPSATVTRLLRRRIYGILLYEYELHTKIRIKEWCCENIDSYKKPVMVTPAKPTVHHPGLLQLWSDDNSDECSEMKWKLFLSGISPNITLMRDWRALPEDLVAISATLFYLLERELVNELEMNAMMAAIATYSLYSREKLNDLCCRLYDPRCTHISVCLGLTFYLVITLMGACGYPLPLSGKLFRMKFRSNVFEVKYKEMEEKKSVEEMCENNTASIEIFNQMKKILSQAVPKTSKKGLDGGTELKAENLAKKFAEVNVSTKSKKSKKQKKSKFSK